MENLVVGPLRISTGNALLRSNKERDPMPGRSVSVEYPEMFQQRRRIKLPRCNAFHIYDPRWLVFSLYKRQFGTGFRHPEVDNPRDRQGTTAHEAIGGGPRPAGLKGQAPHTLAYSKQ